MLVLQLYFILKRNSLKGTDRSKQCELEENQMDLKTVMKELKALGKDQIKRIYQNHSAFTHRSCSNCGTD